MDGKESVNWPGAEELDHCTSRDHFFVDGGFIRTHCIANTLSYLGSFLEPSVVIVFKLWKSVTI